MWQLTWTSRQQQSMGYAFMNFVSVEAAQDHIGLHIGPPHRSLGIPRNFRESPRFLGYFRDFWSNIGVFGQNNVIFELLQQK